MKGATFRQARKILELLDGTPSGQLQELLGSGLLTDLRDANIAQINRDDFRKVCGLKPLLNVLAENMIARKSAVPADGVEFELTLEVAPDPLEMVRADGYSSIGWNFNGRYVAVPQARLFKLVRVGTFRNLDDAWSKFRPYGKIPEGQWREAFRRAFPMMDGKGLIGIADFSWVSPIGDVVFPVLTGGGGKMWNGKFYSLCDIDERYRWLVECRPK